MAALTVTEVFSTGLKPVGDLFLKTFRITVANASAADEWAVTGLSTIVAVLGAVAIGTAADTGDLNVVKNAQGTGVSEDTNPGDLGIESAAALTYEISVLGRA